MAASSFVFLSTEKSGIRKSGSCNLFLPMYVCRKPWFLKSWERANLCPFLLFACLWPGTNAELVKGASSSLTGRFTIVTEVVRISALSTFPWQPAYQRNNSDRSNRWWDLPLEQVQTLVSGDNHFIKRKEEDSSPWKKA